MSSPAIECLIASYVQVLEGTSFRQSTVQWIGRTSALTYASALVADTCEKGEVRVFVEQTLDIVVDVAYYDPMMSCERGLKSFRLPRKACGRLAVNDEARMVLDDRKLFVGQFESALSDTVGAALVSRTNSLLRSLSRMRACSGLFGSNEKLVEFLGDVSASVLLRRVEDFVGEGNARAALHSTFVERNGLLLRDRDHLHSPECEVYVIPKSGSGGRSVNSTLRRVRGERATIV